MTIDNRQQTIFYLHEHIYNKWLWHKLKQYRITDSWNDSGIQCYIKISTVSKWPFTVRKQSFKKLTVILRVTGKLLLKSKDMCLNEIFE